MQDAAHQGIRLERVGCAILTVSDSRTLQTDKSGEVIGSLVQAAGHDVRFREIVPDDTERVRARIKELCADPEVHALLLSGGTGLAPRDTTFEAVSALLDRRIDGFGELFRLLSFEEVGAAAMLSRAVAGLCGSTLVFSMPGSPAAVRLALEKLILPVLGHAAGLVRRP